MPLRDGCTPCSNYRVEIGAVGIKNLKCLAKKTPQ